MAIKERQQVKPATIKDSFDHDVELLSTGWLHHIVDSLLRASMSWHAPVPGTYSYPLCSTSPFVAFSVSCYYVRMGIRA